MKLISILGCAVAFSIATVATVNYLGGGSKHDLLYTVFVAMGTLGGSFSLWPHGHPKPDKSPYLPAQPTRQIARKHTAESPSNRAA